MSDSSLLEKIREKLSVLSSALGKSGSQLERLGGQIAPLAKDVENLVGGSATGVDSELIGSLISAERALTEAKVALFLARRSTSHLRDNL